MDYVYNFLLLFCKRSIFVFNYIKLCNYVQCLKVLFVNSRNLICNILSNCIHVICDTL